MLKCNATKGYLPPLPGVSAATATLLTNSRLLAADIGGVKAISFEAVGLKPRT
jgi:hypothetical protein